MRLTPALALIVLTAVQHVAGRALSEVSTTTDAGRTVPTPFVTFVTYEKTNAKCGDKVSAQEVDILNTECLPLKGMYLSIKNHSDNPGVTYNSLHIYGTIDCSDGWTLEPLDSDHCSDVDAFHSIRFVPNGVEVPDNAPSPPLPTNWPWESEAPKAFALRDTPQEIPSAITVRDDSLIDRNTMELCRKSWCWVTPYTFCCDPKKPPEDSFKELAAELRNDVSLMITFSDPQMTTGIDTELARRCTSGWCNIGRYRFCCSPHEANELDPLAIRKDILSIAEAPAKVARDDTTPVVQIFDKDAFTSLTDSPKGRCKKDWCNIGRYRFCCDPKEAKDFDPNEIAQEISTLAKTTMRYNDEAADIENITANFAHTDDVQKCKKWCWMGRYLFCCKN